MFLLLGSSSGCTFMILVSGCLVREYRAVLKMGRDYGLGSVEL